MTHPEGKLKIPPNLLVSCGLDAYFSLVTGADPADDVDDGSVADWFSLNLEKVGGALDGEGIGRISCPDLHFDPQEFTYRMVLSPKQFKVLDTSPELLELMGYQKVRPGADVPLSVKTEGFCAGFYPPPSATK